MSLVKAQPSDIALRLRQQLQSKYGGGNMLPEYSCLLLDISGSMESGVKSYGSKPRRIDELRKLANEFSDVRRFQFDSTCEELSPKGQIDEPRGGTALDVAFKFVKSKGIRHTVLITDGQPDNEANALLASAGLKIDCFYVGPEPAPQFLKDLCAGSGGTYGKADLASLRELRSAVKERLQIAAPREAIKL